MENPIKLDDLGIPLFLETPIYNSPRRMARGIFDFSEEEVPIATTNHSC